MQELASKLSGGGRDSVVEKGKQLWVSRERLGLTLGEAAKLSGLNQYQVVDIETGRTDDVRGRIKLSAALRRKAKHRSRLF